MRIVFMGTPEFAVPSLKALIDSDFNVVAVFTQPDKPKGRGGKVQQSPVKIYANANNIPVYQPNKISKESLEILKELRPDYCVTAAFGQILSQDILNIPKGTINVHASILPKHRGAAPVQWAILAGDKQTGITTMLTDKGIDTGDILLSQSCEISEDDTAASLLDKLSKIGANLLIRTLNNIQNIKPIKQNNSQASYDPIIKKEHGSIDFEQNAEHIKRLVMAMQPWPKAYFVSRGGSAYKLTQVNILNTKSNKKPGTLVCAEKRIIVSTNSNDIEILRIQAPNKNEISSSAYLLGNKLQADICILEAFK